MSDTSCANHVISILEVGRYFSNLQNLTFKMWQFLKWIEKAFKSFGWGMTIFKSWGCFYVQKSCDFYSKNNQDKIYDSHSWLSKTCSMYYTSSFLKKPPKMSKSTISFNVCQVNFWRLLTKRQRKWGISSNFCGLFKKPEI